MAFPLVIVAILYRLFPRLELSETKERFGSLYEVLKLKSKTALHFNAFFVSRRFIYALTIVTMKSVQGIQVIFMMFQSIGILIYLIYVKPFQEPLLNRLEIFNELCILCTVYHLIIFSDFVERGGSSDSV
jgi:hypothetical protein